MSNSKKFQIGNCREVVWLVTGHIHTTCTWLQWSRYVNFTALTRLLSSSLYDLSATFEWVAQQPAEIWFVWKGLMRSGSRHQRQLSRLGTEVIDHLNFRLCDLKAKVGTMSMEWGWQREKYCNRAEVRCWIYKNNETNLRKEFPMSSLGAMCIGVGVTGLRNKWVKKVSSDEHNTQWRILWHRRRKPNNSQ